MRHGEILQHEGLPDIKGRVNATEPYFGNLRTAKATDTFISDGKTSSYTPSFTYHGFRYVLVSGFAGLTAADIELQHFASAVPLKVSTAFPSSPTIAAIQRLALGAQRSNMMTVLTDCDQRDERLGWMGDADLSADTILTNYDAKAFLAADMQSMQDETDADGSLSDVVPNVRFGGRPGDPSWTAALPQLAFTISKYCGDLAPAKAAWPKLVLHMSHYATLAKASKSKWPPTKYGDWVPAPFPAGKQANAVKPSRPYTSAFAYVKVTQMMVELGTKLGEDVSAYKTLLTTLEAQFKADFYHAGNNTFDTGIETGFSLGLALGQSLHNTTDAKAFANFLSVVKAKKMHETTGIIGGKFFYSTLAAGGQAETALTVLEKTDYPSYGYMFANKQEPATENMWELMDANSEGTGMNR